MDEEPTDEAAKASRTKANTTKAAAKVHYIAMSATALATKQATKLVQIRAERPRAARQDNLEAEKLKARSEALADDSKEDAKRR